MASTFVIEREVLCRSRRQDIWRPLADTERLNRFVGAGRLEVDPIQDSGGARVLIRTAVSGFPLTYRETPFEWIEHEGFSFHRVMIGGLLSELGFRYQLTDTEDGGTRVTVHAEATARSALIVPLGRIVVGRNVSLVCKYIEAIDQKILGERAAVLPATAVSRPHLSDALGALKDRVSPALLDKLASFVLDADDVDAGNARPFELANRWNLDRTEVLSAFLEGVKAGLFELRWGVLCPSCNQATMTLPSLAELDGSAHCNMCEIGFGLELDRSVEAVFRPHTRIRPIDLLPFCVGGPSLVPHVIAQSRSRDGIATLTAPKREGRYRVFVRGGLDAVLDVRTSGPTNASCRVKRDALHPRQLDVAPGASIEVALEKKDPVEERHVKIDRLDFSFFAASAYHVSLLPRFRALFGAESLKPGLALRVAQVTVLFSDLCGSTALYSRVGDAAAFGAVSDCLTFGRERVERHQGVVVKTMGDAVMAAFQDAESALNAASEMILEWESFARTNPLLAELALKVGVYSGPCTIVTANGMIDYFGQTVNSAARVQHLAGPQEIVAPRGLIESVALPKGLHIKGAFDARVKGIEEPLELTRFSASN
jgi:adenylate cyclase